MKVKLADLKTHLSRHLRQIRQTGETVEVCVREDTVAYLTPVAEADRAQPGTKEAGMLHRLHGAGLALIAQGKPPGQLAPLIASAPGDGRTDIATADLLRKERDW